MQALKDWRDDNELQDEVGSVEIDDLYGRLKKLWVDEQIDGRRVG